MVRATEVRRKSSLGGWERGEVARDKQGWDQESRERLRGGRERNDSCETERKFQRGLRTWRKL